MWGFQRTFRSAVEMAFQRSLGVLGVTVEPTVFLIGLLREGGSRHPFCVEPKDGPMAPADFDGLHDRAAELFDQDPDSRVLVSAAWIRARRQQQTRHRAYGTAIGEVLEARLGPGLRFFVGLPTPVEQHLVFHGGRGSGVGSRPHAAPPGSARRTSPAPFPADDQSRGSPLAGCRLAAFRLLRRRRERSGWGMGRCAGRAG
jgi:Probable sensor domain DACNG